MRQFRLDLRKVFRKFGREEQAAYSSALAAASPQKRAPDNKPLGGSLPKAANSSKAILSVKRWGYVLKWHKLGQVLTWFVRGTKRQPARPVRVKTDAEGLARALEDEVAQQFSAWDRSTHA